MTEPSSPTEKVIRVIEEFIEENGHLLTMERIHRNFFDQDITFNSWSDVYDDYRGRTWTKNSSREFVQVTKEIVEGVDDLPETYFKIVEPDDVSLKVIKNRLSEHPYDEDSDGKDRDGFDFDVVDGVIDGRYVYTDVDTRVSYSGGVDDYISEGAIQFRIDPAKDLLILESTRVVDVQKMKSYIKKADLQIVVCRDLTNLPDSAVERINAFIDSFSRDVETPGPTLLQIDRVIMHNPAEGKGEGDDDKSHLKKLDFEGTNIREHPDVQEQLSRGWLIKGIVAAVQFEESIFKIRISGNQVMGYAKVANVKDYNKGTRLLDDIRERYLSHIAS